MSFGSIALRQKLDHLNGIGVAIERFPDYSADGSEPPHTHDVVELAYVLAGGGDHLLGTTSAELVPGSLAIVHYTQPHAFRSTGMDVVNIYLDVAGHRLPDVGGELQSALEAVLPQRAALRHRQHRFVHLRCPPGGAAERHLLALLEEQQARRPGYRAALASLLRLFLIEVARIAREQTAPDTGGQSRSDIVMAGITARIDADPTVEFDLDAVAAESGLTRTSLCRAFKRYAGMPLGGYVERARVQAAMLALRATDDRILDVAMRCGFTDQSFFNRAFKRIAGVSPREYRKRPGS